MWKLNIDCKQGVFVDTEHIFTHTTVLEDGSLNTSLVDKNFFCFHKRDKGNKGTFQKWKYYCEWNSSYFHPSTAYMAD